MFLLKTAMRMVLVTAPADRGLLLRFTRLGSLTLRLRCSARHSGAETEPQPGHGMDLIGDVGDEVGGGGMASARSVLGRFLTGVGIGLEMSRHGLSPSGLEPRIRFRPRLMRQAGTGCISDGRLGTPHDDGTGGFQMMLLSRWIPG